MSAGYGHFLTSWGGTSLVKSLLKPVIVAATYGFGSQNIIDNNLVRTPCACNPLLQASPKGAEMSYFHCKTCAWEQHAPIMERTEPFPVVLFSHGIGGIRNSYSGICSEMASVVSTTTPYHQPHPHITALVLDSCRAE